MPRKSIGETAMTDAERQARYRAARAAAVPIVRVRRPADHRSRARHWTDNVTGLVEARVEYAAWLDRLPDSLQDSATAEALRAICDLDLTELQAIVPPRGFGRDRPSPFHAYPRDAQGPPAPFAPHNAQGAALRARVPPMHDVDTLQAAANEGSPVNAGE